MESKTFNSRIEHAKYLNLTLEEYAAHYKKDVDWVLNWEGPITTDFLVRSIQYGPFWLPNSLDEIKDELMFPMFKLGLAPVERVSGSGDREYERLLDRAGMFNKGGKLDFSVFDGYKRAYAVLPGIQACEEYRKALPHFWDAVNRCRLELGEEIVNKTLHDSFVKYLESFPYFNFIFVTGCEPSEELNIAGHALAELERVKDQEPNVKWYLEEEYPKWRKLYDEACGEKNAAYIAETQRRVKSRLEELKAAGKVDDAAMAAAEKHYGITRDGD